MAAKLPSGDTWYSQDDGSNNESHTPVDHHGDAQVTAHLFVENNDVLNDRQSRTNQQLVLPNAVKSRLMQPVSAETNILSVGAFVPDGLSTTAVLISRNLSGGMILAQPYWQVYIDSHDSSGLLPQSVSSKFFPFYSWSSLLDTLGNPINNQQSISVHRMQVRNASGAGVTHLIYFDVYVRSIQNGSGQRNA